MLDPWIAVEQRALAVVAEVLTRSPGDRGDLQLALHLLAVAKNRDLQQVLPDLSILSDDELVRMAEALVRGNQLGR